MVQYFVFLNLTHGEQGGVSFGFNSFILGNLDAIQHNLSRAKFTTQPPRDLRAVPGVPRSHLGRLSSLPTELIDEIFACLIIPEHVARLAAAHPILGPQGFARIVRIRAREWGRITWHNSRVVLVGDSLRRPNDIDGLLSDDLRAEMYKSQTRYISEHSDTQRNWEESPMSLYAFATYYDPFDRVQANSVGPLKVLELKEDNARRDLPWNALEQRGADRTRIYRLLESAWPIMPSLETAVLCNLTKRQFVRAETVRQFEWGGDEPESGSPPPRNRHHDYRFESPKPPPKRLTIGSTVLFLTVCTDDWDFVSPFIDLEDIVGQGPGAVMGRWAGDCLAVVEPDDVEDGLTDISEEVVSMVRRFMDGMTD